MPSTDGAGIGTIPTLPTWIAMAAASHRASSHKGTCCLHLEPLDGGD